MGARKQNAPDSGRANVDRAGGPKATRQNKVFRCSTHHISRLRRELEGAGLALKTGTQRRVFSINDAENLLKVINANASNDPATNAALGRLRASVKNAILSADDQGGVFAPARQLAAQRFALHDQVPALEASANDRINADDFVRRYLIGGKTDEVSALADLLKRNDLASYNEARSQIGAQLAKKGFGQNPAGDSSFNPSGFASQMQTFGPTKLAAFYSPAELEQLNAIGRVGSYIGSVPSSSPVNFSNTGSAVASLAGEGLKKIPYIGGLIQNAENRMFVKRALGGLLSDAITQPAQTRPPSLLDTLLLNQVTQTPPRH